MENVEVGPWLMVLDGNDAGEEKGGKKTMETKCDHQAGRKKHRILILTEKNSNDVVAPTQILVDISEK